MFNQLVYQPLFQTLVFLYHLLGDNLGLAIIALTLLIRFLLIPFTLPSLKVVNKLKDLKPQLDELKRQFGNDKARFQQEQMKLYQEHKINPVSGCLPQIATLVVFYALYRVFIDFLKNGTGVGQGIGLNFLWFNLANPDTLYILPALAGLSQLILSLMVLPGADTTAERTLASKTPSKADDKKAEDMTDMATTMQQQMVFIFPVMIFFAALKFPSGLAVYWVITTVFSVVQQYFISGLGGLVPQLQKVTKFFRQR
ncbi:hypothetical protein A2783_01645 [Microgenomates group bacterium RIFCSPHIGHO2_01_FULL_45_11]|nr:MAG: hypothetical protein A2783_01645 [Microgenomates group bacterium RIFCSPHIGHO2_01_FULL_45_11]